MTQIQLRLPPALLEAVTLVARAKGIPRTEYIRRCIRLGLEAERRRLSRES